MTNTMQEAAGQKPVPSVNPAVNPQVAGPVLPSPPHPVLQSAGFAWGGIDEFNKRIQGVVDAYQDAHGERPPAGIALDVARSKVQPEDYGKLFQTHLANPMDAQLYSQVKQHQQTDPTSWSVVRPDGLAEPNRPVRQLLMASGDGQQTARANQVSHPWIPTGSLPLPPKLEAAAQQAMADQQKTGNVLQGGKTLQQYQADQMRATNPFTHTYTLQQLKPLADIKTVQQMQQYLQKIAPDFFGTLSPTGYVSTDWASEIVKYQKSSQYIHQENIQLATNAGFGTNTGEFIKVWGWQQEAIRKHPDEAPLLRALPLSVFALMGPDSWTMGHDIGPLINYLTGNTHGWGWLNVPTWLVGNVIPHAAGLITDVFGGSLGSAELDAAGARAVVRAVLPKDLGGKGETWDEAVDRFKIAIRQEPNILSVLNENFHGQKTWEGQLVNTMFALVIGMGALTGAKVGAGDIEKLMKTTAFNSGTALSFNALAKGDLRQALKALEGKGLGADKLVNEVAPLVQSGEMNLTQYRRVVAELWSRGHTTISSPKDIEEILPPRVYPWTGKKPGDEFTFTGTKGKETGFIDPKGVPRNSDGAALFDINTLDTDKLKGDIKKELAGGQYEYIGPLPTKDLKDLYPGDVGTLEASAKGITLDDASGILTSLRTRSLHSKGFTGAQLTRARQAIRDTIDDFEQRLRTNPGLGLTNHASDFLSNVRQQFARATTYGRVYAFNPRAPEDIYNWAVVELKDRKVATQLSNELIHARATDDVAAIARINDQARALFLEAHPGEESRFKSQWADTSGPQVESEARAYLNLPKSLEQRAQKINEKLNDVGRGYREIIISGAPIPGVPGGGEVLAWKHAFDDTLRRMVGGGGKFDPEVFGRLAGTAKSVDAVLKADPALFRLYSARRAGAVLGENRWATGAQYESVKAFDTGTAFGDSAKMTAAGQFLFHKISSEALRAYQKSSVDNLDPLTKLVLTNPRFKHFAFDGEAWKKISAQVHETYGLAGKERAKEALDTAAYDWAAAYARDLFQTYREIEKAGEDKGIANPLGEALDLAIKNSGPKVNEALGKWIAKKKIDFPVKDAMVIGSGWDSGMQKWISTLMIANKWNRGKLFDNVFYATVKDLTSNGWKMNEAIPVAADLAHTQTVYHMLDFANMLKIEQSLRWVAPFITKHRLYWTWIIKQAVQRPGLAALVYEVGKHLDANGNVQFQVGGRTLEVPITRLLWANASGYPQTSPLITGIAGFLKGMWDTGSLNEAVGQAEQSMAQTSGNLVTRDDQAWALTIPIALIAAGKMQATAGAVTAYMSPSGKKSFDTAVNEYIQGYFTDTGRWPTEADAVNHVLLTESAHAWWNANLPFPIEWPSPSSTPPNIKAKLVEYDKLNQEQKYVFLQNNPDVALHFGISTDPAIYLHNQPLWQRYNAIRAVLKAKQHELWTEEITSNPRKYDDARAKLKALSLWFDQQLAALEYRDALTWHGTKAVPAGVTNDKMVVVPGPWSQQLHGDPLATRAFVHMAFAGIPQQQLDSHTIGAAVAGNMARADQLRLITTSAQAAKLGMTLAEAQAELRTKNKMLAPWFSSAKSTDPKVVDYYLQHFVTPYIKQREKLTALANTSSDLATEYKSDLRYWKDSHDHPVTFTLDGQQYTMPSVVLAGVLALPSSTLQKMLDGEISGNYQHVSDYDKRLMGLTVGPEVSKGWAVYATTITNYDRGLGNKPLVAAQRLGLAKKLDKLYPGFYKDYLFSIQPKIYRWQATEMYRSLPERAEFDYVVTIPAKKFLQAIAQSKKSTGTDHRSYYEKAWRQYIEEKVLPWIATQPDLNKALSGYGKNFLNTLLSNG